MKSKKRIRIELPNGCSCSTPSVYPRDWKSCGKSALKKNWRIQYYFYDPELPKPTNPIVVKGMNTFNTLESRRNATRVIYQDEIEALKDGFHPYKKDYISPKKLSPLHEHLLVIDAFWAAFKKLDGEPKHKYQVKRAIKRVEAAINELRFSNTKIIEFKRRQLKECFDYLKLSPHVHNKFKSYFSSLYRILIEYECVDTNITRDISKKTIIKNKRDTIPYNKAMSILTFLKENGHYNFYRYAMIFFYSGGRSAELLRVQAKNVRLAIQEYDVLIKKGKQYVWETKIIIPSAVPFWSEIIDLVNNEDDYIFSHNLIPGDLPINPHQITKRWRIHVKKPLGITADFYSLKHTFLDYLDEKSNGQKTAQNLASHRSGSITHKVYTINKRKRENEALKKITL